jgi:hypothetical protein
LFEDPQTMPDSMMPYRGGIPQSPVKPFLRSPHCHPGTAFVKHRLLAMAQQIECLPAPLGSHLVVFRFSAITRTTLLPYQGSGEEFLALDTQIADWLPPRVFPALLEKYS